MSDKTKIEWCDATVNAWRGCSKVSEWCKNCYAVAQVRRIRDCFPGDERFRGLVDGPRGGALMDRWAWTGGVKFDADALALPFKWKKPKAIFWNSLSDTFHEQAADEWRDQLFMAAALTERHQHLVLTKRPERMRDYLIDGRTPERVAERIWNYSRVMKTANYLGWMISNVWLGVTVENQARADERLPILAGLAAAGWKTFVSVEPMLSAISLKLEAGSGKPGCVIVGGESGPGARPMHPDWVRSIRDQCAAAGVPFYFKQWGEWAQITPIRTRDAYLSAAHVKQEVVLVRQDGSLVREGNIITTGDAWMARLGKKLARRVLDGRTHDALPWRVAAD